MRVAVFTAITGDYESLKEPPEGADCFFFTDQLDAWHKQYENQVSPAWRVRPATDVYSDPVRNARYHKAMPHEVMPQYDVWVWLDGSMRLLVPIQELLDRFPGDLVAFAHPDRDCLYDEARSCQQMSLDYCDVIERQIARYREVGYPAHNGLAETKCVIRRDTPLVRKFNCAWRHEIVNGSLRDQISFNYTAWAVGIKVDYMPAELYRGEVFTPKLYRGPLFEYVKHARKQY